MKRLWGGLLLAVGVLITGASGLCTASAVFLGSDWLANLIYTLPMAIFLGGIPIAIGIATIVYARDLLQPDDDD